MNKNMIKRRYDTTIDRYVKKDIHTGEIYGEGLMDIFKSMGRKLFSKTAKSATNKAFTKVGENIGNRAGDKIVQLLSKKQPIQQTIKQPPKNTTSKPLTDFEIAQRVNRLISGGRMMKI